MRALTALTGVLSALYGTGCDARGAPGGAATLRHADARADAGGSAWTPPQPEVTQLSPACDQIHACLREALPAEYDAPRDLQRHAQAYACLGGTPEAVDRVRGCLPFRFGRDAFSGRELELFASCDDLCPDYTKTGVRFSERLHPLECLCVGGWPLRSSGWGAYLGCGPDPHDASSAFQVEPHPMPTRPVGYKVTGLSKRLAATGVVAHVPVKSIEGRPLRTQRQLEQLLAGLPNQQPASISFWPSPSSGPSWLSTLYFVPLTMFERLAELADSLGFESLAYGAKPCRDASEWSTVRIGDSWARYDPACHDEVSQKLHTLAQAIRRATRTARRRTVSRPVAGSFCQRLQRLPVEAWLTGPAGDRIELRYIDWLVR